MVLSWTGRGLRRAFGEPRLVALLWLVNLLVSVLAALPLVSRLVTVLPASPEADASLGRFSISLAHDMLLGQIGLWSAWVTGLAAFAFLALVLNALLAGGTLECLQTHDERSFGHRFGRGAGRTFWPFLRLGLVAGPLALLGGGALAVAVGAVGGRLDRAAWEPAELTVRAAGALLGTLLLTLALMALDFTRIEIVRSSPRAPLRLFFRRCGALLRRPAAPLGLWLANTALLVGVLALYLLVRRAVPVAGWVGLAAMVVAQQAVIASRAVLRIALWSAEGELVESRWPAVPPPAGLPVEEEAVVESATDEPDATDAGTVEGEVPPPPAAEGPHADGALPETSDR